MLDMKNYQVNNKLKQLFRAKEKFHLLLNEVEDEIKRRHGCTPADVDLEEYIDSYHYGSNVQMTIEEIDEKMKLSIENSERVDLRIEF